MRYGRLSPHALRDLPGDLVDTQLHHLRIGERQVERCALATRRADGAEQVGIGLTLVGGLARPRAHVGEAKLFEQLADIALAAGHQPAVLKVVSYAHGGARASATAQYAQRDEAQLETHDSRILPDKEAVAAEMRAWAKDFDKRKESDDIANVRLAVDGLTGSSEDRTTLDKTVAAAFDGHRHAYRIDVRPDGALEARIVTALAGGHGERFRLSLDRDGQSRSFNPKSMAAIEARVAQTAGIAPERLHVTPGRGGHGPEAARFRLSQLVATGAATTDTGRTLATAQDAQGAVQDWKRAMRSFKPRDTMHLVLSAKADTNVEAFGRTVRAFLHDEFANHKFAFAIHTDKAATAGHIHAHAIVTVKSESGERLHPGPAHFRAWRETFAEIAQAEGLKIVATGAMERASSQSYGPRDKAIVDAGERPRPGREERDRAYAKHNPQVIDNARRRIETARANPVRLPVTKRERAVVNGSLAEWTNIAKNAPDNAAAQDNIIRLSTAAVAGHIIHKLTERAAAAEKGSHMAVTSQQMKIDLRAMNETVNLASAELTGATQAQFMDRAGRALETMAMRVDIQAAKERGVETLSRAAIERIAGVSTERLIARARRIEREETGQAVSAEAVAARGVEIERLQSGNTAIDPASLEKTQAERVFARDAIATASRERREADAASLAAQQLAAHPARALDPHVVKTANLAELQAEQDRALDEIKAREASESERIKPTRQR